MNAIEIEEAVSRLAEQPFDPEAFPYAFLGAFGNKDTTLTGCGRGNPTKPMLTGLSFSTTTSTSPFALPGRYQSRSRG